MLWDYRLWIDMEDTVKPYCWSWLPAPMWCWLSSHQTPCWHPTYCASGRGRERARPLSEPDWDNGRQTTETTPDKIPLAQQCELDSAGCSSQAYECVEFQSLRNSLFNVATEFLLSNNSVFVWTGMNSIKDWYSSAYSVVFLGHGDEAEPIWV